MISKFLELDQRDEYFYEYSSEIQKAIIKALDMNKPQIKGLYQLVKVDYSLYEKTLEKI